MGARVAAVRRGRRRGARLHVHGATAAAAQIVRWRSSGGRMMALALLVLWFTFLLCVFRLCLCCLSLARDAAVLTACEVCASAEQNGSSGEQNAKNGNEIRNFWTSRVPTPSRIGPWQLAPKSEHRHHDSEHRTNQDHRHSTQDSFTQRCCWQ